MSDLVLALVFLLVVLGLGWLGWRHEGERARCAERPSEPRNEVD